MRADYRAYEFSRGTRNEAILLAGYSCEACNINYGAKKIQTLQAHHLLPIWFAANFYPELSPNIIKNIVNTVVLCPQCHDQLHERENERQRIFQEVYAFLAKKALISPQLYLECQPKQLIFSLAKLTN